MTDQLKEVVLTAARLLESHTGGIERASDAIICALAHGHKILLFGNGGSAAAAQHLAAEFVGRFQRERRPCAALALTTDSSVITAIANDYGFDMVFARQVRALGCPGDVAIGISTSGESLNVLNGICIAADMGLTTVGLTGGDGGSLAKLAAISIIAPADSTPRIQECHIAIGHILCDLVDSFIVDDSEPTPRLLAGEFDGRLLLRRKLRSWPELMDLRNQWKDDGKRVVWTNGCFDLLHAGHLHSLRAARRLGDVLVVGVNSDESVRQLKGRGRPIVPVNERAELLGALECVDAVVIVEESSPAKSLSELKPDVHCKGAEYADSNGSLLPESSLVASYGGRVEFLPMLPKVSTTWRIQQIRQLQARTSNDES